MTIFKFSSFANSDNNGRSRFRKNAFNFGKLLTSFGLPEYRIDFFIKKVYTKVAIVKEIIKFHNCSAHSSIETVF